MGGFILHAGGEAQDGRELLGEGLHPLKGGNGVKRFKGEQAHVKGTELERVLQRGDHHKGTRIERESIFRFSPFVNREFKAQTALAQLVRDLRLFHENDLVARQGEAPADIRANGPRAEG